MKKVFVQLELGRGYGRDILKGIHEYNNQYSEWEIIFEPAYYLRTAETGDIIKLISELRPDGCIFEYMENSHEIDQLGIPVIQTSWGGHLSNTPFLKGNYDADGKMALDYFSSQGFKNLAFFGVKKVAWSDGRFMSFKHHAELKNIHVYDYMSKIKRKKGVRHNLKNIISWLQSLPKPIGILCCNDDFGLILINACSMGGLKIPYEIAVLGIDNDDLMCNITNPHLSSIARNHTKAAFNACMVLNSMMNGQIIKDMIIPTEPINIIERTSTDTIACSDFEVINALHYIRNNMHMYLSVDDVVDVTNISRRNLYTRFKNITGNTIYQEIKFQKLIKFKELLGNKNLSIKEIAFRLGFEDVTHVSRWFSAIEGVSPLKWRKDNST